MRLNHPEILDLYEEVRDHHADLDHRQERMGASLTGEGPRTVLERLRDLEARLMAAYSYARRGERVPEGHVFGLVADAIALEHVQRVAEETSIEAGDAA